MKHSLCFDNVRFRSHLLVGNSIFLSSALLPHASYKYSTKGISIKLTLIKGTKCEVAFGPTFDTSTFNSG